MPKVLVLDIETQPSLAYVWGLFNQNIGLSQVVQAGDVICFAAKWVGEKKVHFYSDFHDGHDVVIQKARDLLDEADIVVTFYGSRFDIPHLNREMVVAGLTPPSPYKSVDLKLVVSKQFKFVSSKLAHVTEQLGLSGKMSNEGFGLWVKCIQGDATAWNTLKRYNLQDVRVTEELYLRLLPWIPSHPNVNLIDGNTDRPACHSCGSEDIQWRGWAHTLQSSYRRFQCQGCGAWGRSTKAEARVSVRGAL